MRTAGCLVRFPTLEGDGKYFVLMLFVIFEQYYHVNYAAFA